MTRRLGSCLEKLRQNGSAGRDSARFTNSLNSSNNVDTVTGHFAVDDAIRLENSILLKLITIDAPVISRGEFFATCTARRRANPRVGGRTRIGDEPAQTFARLA